MNTPSPQPEKPRQTPTESNPYRAEERGTNWLVIVFKLIAFLILGTIGLAVLFFGTCVLLMRH